MNNVNSHQAGACSHGSITDVPGIAVGHYTDSENATGCTAVLPSRAAVAGVDVRGAAPGSRETEMLHPLATAEEVHGLMLAGGSAYGLAAATGAARWLEEHGIGLRLGRILVPLVPSAIIFDLGLVTHLVRPNEENGHAAFEAASSRFSTGSVGAGTGATIGKLEGMGRAVKGGVGTASVDLGGGLFVGALIVANPVGGVVDPDTGEVVAGPRVEDSEGRRFQDSVRLLIDEPSKLSRPFSATREDANTVIGVVATNATMNKKAAIRLAGAGQDAIAMCVRPAHTSRDGDTIFTLATGDVPDDAHEDRLRAGAIRAASQALLCAAGSPTGLGGVPSASEFLAGEDA